MFNLDVADNMNSIRNFIICNNHYAVVFFVKQTFYETYTVKDIQYKGRKAQSV